MFVVRGSGGWAIRTSWTTPLAECCHALFGIPPTLVPPGANEDAQFAHVAGYRNFRRRFAMSHLSTPNDSD